MALQCPLDFDTEMLRERVQSTYERVARDPAGDFHFRRGPGYAVECLGYDSDELARIPPLASARFAGVGNPHRIGPIHPGETVLDHACGAGTDLLLAARRVGPRGRAIGVDMTPPMCEVARRAAALAGLASIVEVRQGFFEDLPVESASVDVVISNGVLNLAPDKRRVLAEVFRVLVPGGRLYLSDVVVRRELKLEARSDPELWAACVGGALTENELAEAARAAGLEGCRLLDRYDCYAHTSVERKVSWDLQPRGVNFFARKPA